MNRKFLIIHSSRHDSTKEIADYMSAQLKQTQGVSVEVRRASDNTDVRDYDCVIIGGAIYEDRWLPSGMGCLERNKSLLEPTRTWLFSSGPVNPDFQGEIIRRSRFPDDFEEIISTVSSHPMKVFAGSFDAKHLSLDEWLMKRDLRAVNLDCRDWEDIADWLDLVLDQTTSSQLTSESCQQKNPKEKSNA